MSAWVMVTTRWATIVGAAAGAAWATPAGASSAAAASAAVSAAPPRALRPRRLRSARGASFGPVLPAAVFARVAAVSSILGSSIPVSP
ncbi:hypothetical protein Saso_48510 [Streptomyces asoensis]|uniref:Secreted protein n=1 Tax=Streptomyces asoensis TaxID=249586 RepID=A0ABQ3S4Y3_9ACTN|nr:hypothetical protein GCM10010496_31180 [Streptomyces asoensis]GHI63201.1 hypothetical protein Saso_48510 [Streptomyces asoensis]